MRLALAGEQTTASQGTRSPDLLGAEQADSDSDILQASPPTFLARVIFCCFNSLSAEFSAAAQEASESLRLETRFKCEQRQAEILKFYLWLFSVAATAIYLRQ